MSITRPLALLALAGAAASCARAPDTGDDSHLAEAREAASAPTCVTIARGALGDIADATINAGGPTKSYGGAGSITASSGSSGLRQGLIRFDLSPIPAGATITSATAALTTMLYGGAPIAAHRALSPWSESTVTWASFAGAYAPAVEGTFAATTTPSVDLTTLVQAWVSGAQPNHGLLLERTVDGSTVFASSEHIASMRPKLDVCYVAATCTDGVQNQGETGVDCGGPCAPCNLCLGVTCAASDQCHLAGTCNPTTGQCSHPNKPDWTSCDDGDANTTGDICIAGVCAGVDHCVGVTCAPPAQCHQVGTCTDHATGACTYPMRNDGTACDDGNPLTTGDQCILGVCGGVDACVGVMCAAPDACHLAGVCSDHATGACTYANAPAGTPCGANAACDGAGSCASSCAFGGYGAYTSYLIQDTWNQNQGAFAVADVDGDGKLDLVVLDLAMSGPSAIRVRRGNGDGTFGAPVDHPVAAQAEWHMVFGTQHPPMSALLAADLDGDGRPDLAFMAGYPQRFLYLMHNQGDGTFASPTSIALGDQYVEMHAADLNGDGRLDLVLSGDTSTAVLLNQGGALAAPSTLMWGAAAVADLNGDGALDLALTEMGGWLHPYFNQGDGTFANQTSDIACATPYTSAAADFDGDGAADVAVVCADWGQGWSMRVMRNQGGVFGSSLPVGASYALGYSAAPAVSVTDVDRDGKPDLVFARWSTSYMYQAPFVSVWRNGGAGTFGSMVDYPLGSASWANPDWTNGHWNDPNSVAVVDLDGNGLPDILAGGDHAVSVLLATCAP